MAKKNGKYQFDGNNLIVGCKSKLARREFDDLDDWIISGVELRKLVRLANKGARHGKE